MPPRASCSEREPGPDGARLAPLVWIAVAYLASRIYDGRPLGSDYGARRCAALPRAATDGKPAVGAAVFWCPEAGAVTPSARNSLPQEIAESANRERWIGMGADRVKMKPGWKTFVPGKLYRVDEFIDQSWGPNHIERIPCPSPDTLFRYSRDPESGIGYFDQVVEHVNGLVSSERQLRRQSTSSASGA